ncbi:PA domain [Dillenia turbinata]|uniref:PA domain n=1 Tax=Dillenia turbinata TaxID=194707 RepID=A0AAN8VKC9_9MAGN
MNGNLSSAQCEIDSLDDVDVKGKIVLCEGGYWFDGITKGQVVKDAGGAAMILMNIEDQGYMISPSLHVLPATAISYSAGLKIKGYINSTSSPTATLRDDANLCRAFGHGKIPYASTSRKELVPSNRRDTENQVHMGKKSHLDIRNLLQLRDHTVHASHFRKCQNGSLAGVDVKGKIVMCEGGLGVDELDREKGQVVKDAGGAAMILINLESGGYVTSPILHVLPATSIPYTAERQFKGRNLQPNFKTENSFESGNNKHTEVDLNMLQIIISTASPSPSPEPFFLSSYI